MSSTEESELAAVIDGWDGAWRQPKLFATTTTSTNAVDASTALLNGLLKPVQTPREGIQRLIDEGLVQAARKLLAQVHDQLTIEERDTLDQQARRRAAAARTELEPRAHRLLMRAISLGISKVDGAWSTALGTSVRAAEDELRQAEEDLDLLAEELRTEIQSHFPNLNEARVTSAKACLGAGEYAVAKQIVTYAEQTPWLDNPALISKTPHWAYRARSDREVLGWFVEESAAPLDFDQHRPAKDDAHGHALIRALHGVFSELNKTTATAFGDAFDGLLQDAPIAHRAQASGSGFTVQLRGAKDLRLNWLNLPQQLPLHIGEEPPEPTGQPLLWLNTGKKHAPVAGVVRLEPHRLYGLLETDHSGKAQGTHWRRTNVLREICSQLPFDQVAADLPGEDITDYAALRASLLWVFDLLGMRASPEVPDTIIYYCSEVPTAFDAVVRLLSASVRRPGPVTLDDLNRLWEDSGVVSAIRDAVFAMLDDDTAARVVYSAVLLCAAEKAETEVTSVDLQNWIDRLTNTVREIYDEQTHHYPKWYISADRIDVPETLRRLQEIGLLQPGSATRLPGTGLAVLLSRANLEAWTAEQFSELHAVLFETQESAQNALLNRTERQNTHAKKGYEYSLMQLQSALSKTSNPMRTRQLETKIQAHQKQIADIEAMQRGDVESLVQVTEFDVISLVAEVVEVRRATDQAEIELIDRLGSGRIANAIEVIVNLALIDLLHNAVQAMTSANVGRKRIRVTIRQRTGAVEAYAAIHVEDSGPGFGANTSALLDQLRKANKMPGGEGLQLMQRNLSACRCKLEILNSPSCFGGAHVAVLVPLLAKNALMPQ